MNADYVATDASGRILSTGDTITDFRGQEWTYIRVSRLPMIGKSAKVYVQSPDNELGQEFYAEVFDVKVFPSNFVEFEGDLEYTKANLVYWLRFDTVIPENVTESWADDHALTVTYRFLDKTK